VDAVLDQAALQISREREASQPRRPLLLLLPELLRNALASLALALGFAALARQSGSARSCSRNFRTDGGVLGSAAQAGALEAPGARSLLRIRPSLTPSTSARHFLYAGLCKF